MTHLLLADSRSLRSFAFAICCGLALGAGAREARAQDATARPSFSCARAASADENLICSDPLLSERDAELARAYRALLAASKDPARLEDIRTDQHAWILRRNAECGVFKSTRIGDKDRGAYVDCFLDSYEERLADLAQMARAPTLAAGAISTPIRKPLPSSVPEELASARSFLIATRLTVALGAIAPQVRWLDADRLVAIDVSRALVTWSMRRRSLTRTDVAIATDIADPLCTADGDVFVGARPEGPLRKLAIDLAGRINAAPAAEALRGRCATEALALSSGDVIVADPAGAWVLNLGLDRRESTVPLPRFVTESQGGRAPIPLTPPIRVDSRAGLRGAYLDFLERFLLWYQPARLSRGEGEAMLRRWAKYDCLPYWIVDPAQSRADARCIPFGGYNQLRPIPVITKVRRFFLATTVPKAVADEAWLGFFELEPDGAAKRIAAGTYTYAETSPDGCKVALVDDKLALSVFDACAAFPL